MGEINNNNWWKKIEQSDGDKGRNKKEQFAIDFLNKNRAVLPSDRFAKLVEQTAEIVKKRDIQEQQIQVECQKALERLKEKTLVEQGGTYVQEGFYNITDTVSKTGVSVQNIITEAEVKRDLGLLLLTDSLDERGFSDIGLHGFDNNRGNFMVTIPEFERILKNETNVKNINSRALSNYFSYLHSKGKLTPEILLEKFGNNTLFQLGQLWSNGGDSTGGEKNRFIAKHTLEKRGLGSIIEIIKTFSSPENFLEKMQTLKKEDEQKIALLFLEKNLNSIKDGFKKDLKAKFIKNNPTKVNEADKIIDGMLEELMKHRDLKGLSEIYRIFDKYNQQHRLGLNIKNATTKTLEICTAESKCNIAQIDMQEKAAKDPKEKKKLNVKKKVIELEMKNVQIAAKVNEKITDKERQDLVSGKKQITQVVQDMRERDQEFNKDYIAWERQDKKLQYDIAQINKEILPQKTSTPHFIQTESSISHHHVSINKLEIGQEVSYNLSRGSNSQKQDKVRIKKIGDNDYEFQVADHDRVTLTKKETEGYLRSFRFLENSGLGYLIRNIQPKALSNIISLAGKDGHRINNQDGDFTEYERFFFLKTLGKVLGIEKMDETINYSQSKELLKKTFYLSGSTTEGGFEKIATKIGLIRNGGFKIDEFIQRIKRA